MTPRQAKRTLSMFLVRPARRHGVYVARWIDPRTKKMRQRTTGCRRRGDAEDAAGEIALGEIARASGGLPWDEFVELYLRALQGKTTEGWSSVCSWVRRLGPPAALEEMDRRWVAHWKTRLEGAGLAESTVAGYTARLKASLNWAEEHGLIEHAPRIRVSQPGHRRSREVWGEEFDRMLEAARRVRPRDWPAACRFLSGLYYTGLRLNDLRRLSWDEVEPIWLDCSGDYPLVRLARDSHKGGRLDYRPVRPEFWEMVRDDDRTGYVCFWANPRGEQIARRTAQKLVAQIGQRAGVRTGEGRKNKTATAHDLRRSYGRWMLEHFGADAAQTALGHASAATTRTYYAQRTAADLAALIFRQAGAALPINSLP